nr:unnamed protein product [Callosobruchus analis]
MKIMLWNAHSAVINKHSLVKALLEFEIDVALISETWFKPNLNYKFNGYKVVRQDRLDGTTGVGILIKNNIRFQEVTLNNIPDSIQACAVNISINHISLTLLSVYCPPTIRTSSQIFLNIFNNFTGPTIIGGDFNGHHNLWSSYKINDLVPTS